MPYTPKDAKALVQSLAARVIARTDLTDLAEGSVLMHLVSTVAEELALAELRLKQIRDSYNPETAAGADLDERARELPPHGMQRRSATRAQGAVLELTRIDEATPAQVAAGENYPDPLTVPKGALFRRSDDPTQTYETTEDVTFAGSAGAGLPGESTKGSVYVRAMTPGTLGNCDISSVVEIVSAPSQIIAVTNTVALDNGHARESDAQLRERMLVYMASLARCQPAALEFAALDFESSLGTRAMYAKVYEDPTNRGYSELVIDDGSGLEANTTPGASTEGLVPAHGQVVLYHEAPATAPIQTIRVSRGGVVTTYRYDAGQYISLPERGLVYFPEGVLLPSDKWQINGYDVYTGLVSELQQYIEGDTSRPIEFPGWRAAGTRVVVRPARTEYLAFDMHVIPRQYIALGDVSTELETAAVEWFRGLAPGETMYASQLLERLMDNTKVISVRLYEPSTSTFLQDHPAPAYDASWRTTAERITVIPATED